MDQAPFIKFKGEVVNAMEILRKSFKSLIQNTMDNPKFTELYDKKNSSQCSTPKSINIKTTFRK